MVKFLFLLFVGLVAGVKDLNEPALAVIQTGASEIYKNVNQNDILVFIGNSASYFYHALNHATRAHLVPGSAMTYIGNDPSSYVHRDAEGLERYDEVFLDPIRKEALLTGKTIVLIDFSTTGRSVDVFNSLLKFDKVEFVHLSVSSRFPLRANSPKTLETRSMIILPDIFADLADGVYIRLVPKLKKSQWSDVRPSIVTEYEQQPDVRRNIDLIKPLDVSKAVVSHSLSRPVEFSRLGDLIKTSLGVSESLWPRMREGVCFDLSVMVQRVRDSLKYAKAKNEVDEDFIMDLEDAAEESKRISLPFSPELIAYHLAMMADAAFFSESILRTVEAWVRFGLLQFILFDEDIYRDLGRMYVSVIRDLPVKEHRLESLVSQYTGIESLSHVRPDLFHAPK